MDKERVRVWGREKVTEELKAKAEQPLDAHALDERPDVKQRVLTMSFAEVVARLGFVTYQGKASFELARNKGELEVFEDSLIQHGLHGGPLLATDTVQCLDGAVRQNPQNVLPHLTIKAVHDRKNGNQNRDTQSQARNTEQGHEGHELAAPTHTDIAQCNVKGEGVLGKRGQPALGWLSLHGSARR